MIFDDFDVLGAGSQEEGVEVWEIARPRIAYLCQRYPSDEDAGRGKRFVVVAQSLRQVDDPSQRRIR